MTLSIWTYLGSTRCLVTFSFWLSSSLDTFAYSTLTSGVLISISVDFAADVESLFIQNSRSFSYTENTKNQYLKFTSVKVTLLYYLLCQCSIHLVYPVSILEYPVSVALLWFGVVCCLNCILFLFYGPYSCFCDICCLRNISCICSHCSIIGISVVCIALPSSYICSQCRMMVKSFVF